MTEHDDSQALPTHLELVEEYPREPVLTQFEKILVAAKRAKDLHDHDKVELVHSHLTAPYTALQELRLGMILAAYAPEEEPPALLEDDSEDADEE